jgi:hypothetical protein
MFIFLTLLVVFFVLLFIGKAETKYQVKKKIKKAFESNLIYQKHFDLLINELDVHKINPLVVEPKIQLYQREKYIHDKYDNDTAIKILNHNYWIGMTEEQLIDCKGLPSKVEKEELKTKIKTTYIYGNKNSGDYFIIENNQVVKIVDR